MADWSSLIASPLFGAPWVGAPLVGLLLALGACIGLAARVAGLRGRLARAEAAHAAADAGRQAATRLLGLAAAELRAIGLALRGHGEHRGGPGAGPGTSADGAALITLSGRVLGLADEVQEESAGDPGDPSLREELVDPAEALSAAVAATALALAPGRRRWQVQAAERPAMLWVDRRALRHVLGRVLAAAACSTRQDDAIDIAVGGHPDGLCLTVEDEGTGLANPEPGQPGGRDSRGIGLRLARARALMLAHGGRLEVEAVAEVGTRVRLVFPHARLRDAAGRPGSAAPAAAVPSAAPAAARATPARLAGGQAGVLSPS